MPPPNPPQPLPSLPFHPIPGLSNFRDIGGWPITLRSTSSASPQHVRPLAIFRGSDTTRITPVDITALRSLHIDTDFDLRSKQQIEKAGGFKDMSAEGIQRIWAPVFGEEEYTEEKAKERYEMYASDETEGIVTAFIEILLAGAPMIKTVLLHLLATHSSSTSSTPPALFLHCTTGNNRTGVFIALLLLLLHVPRQHIVHEYTLSDVGMAATRHINVDRLLSKGAFAEYAPDEARRKCERMVGARAESMEALLDEVERRWGGAEGYFRGVVGLSEEQIEGVRRVMVVDGEGRASGRR